MSREHKDFMRRNQLLPTKEEQEAAVRSIAAMFPSDFEWVARALLECLDVEKLEEGWCYSCDGPGRLRHPDWNARRKTIELLLAHKIGKPVERRQVDITTRVLESNEQFEQLSDAELLAIEEGEWKPVLPQST